MAAATINSQSGRHIIGDTVQRTFDISGASGSTIATGIINPYFIEWQQVTSANAATAITGYTITAAGVLTLTTAGGAMTHEVVCIWGREG